MQNLSKRVCRELINSSSHSGLHGFGGPFCILQEFDLPAAKEQEAECGGLGAQL